MNLINKYKIIKNYIKIFANYRVSQNKKNKLMIPLKINIENYPMKINPYILHLYNGKMIKNN